MAECPAHLVYVNDSDTGYKRVRAGETFMYLNEQEKPLKDKKALGRIKKLVIPPQWENVWICPLENGHIQSTGKDARNRKQYIYHTEWVSYRQASKYAKLYEFGHALPRMRSKINQHLNEKTFTCRKTIALAVKLLDCNYLRIGNDFYLSENETYGLTTIRRKHLHESGQGLRLEYRAKSGKFRKMGITNKKLARMLKQVNELPGYEVFRYRENGRTRRILSDDVNLYIKEISGEDFTAKDFRTWGGTITAIDEFEAARAYAEQGRNRKLETAIVRRVANVLGNTVATARAYYIHPAVLSALLKHGPEPYDTPEAAKLHKGSYLKKNEAIALKMMEELTC